MVYNTQNYWIFGLFPSSGILENRKHDVSETGSVSVLTWPITSSEIRYSIYSFPSPQQEIRTRHTFAFSYNIKPSSGIGLFYIHLYLSVSIPILASVYILEYWRFSSM
jgi:hypothetical protein